MKPDISKQQKKVKEKYEKVKHLIDEMDDDGKKVRIVASTTLRSISGRPPVEIINPNLEEALKDLDTLENIHAAKSI